MAQTNRRRWTRESLGRAALALVTLGAAWSALAAPVGQGVPLFGGRLYPSLGIEQNYQSNYLRVDEIRLPDGTKAQRLSTWTSILKPRLNWSSFAGERASRAVRFEYGADLGTVWSAAENNYVDHRFNASTNLELNLSNRLRVEYEFLYWHDRRGTSDPEDVSRVNFGDHPDLWQSNRFLAGWSIGRPGREDLIDLWVAHHARRYINNDQELRDNDRLTLNATLSRLVLPKTRALLQVNWHDIHYIRQREGMVTRDSVEQALYSGVLWDLSRKTSVALKGGYLAKDFENPRFNDVNTFGWELNVRWRPTLERTVLDLATKRETNESAMLDADGTVISSVTANWVQHLRPNRLWYELGGRYAQDDYNGSPRVDSRWQFRAGLYGRVAQRFLLGLQYQQDQRESDIPEAGYRNEQLMMTIDFGL